MFKENNPYRGRYLKPGTHIKALGCIIVGAETRDVVKEEGYVCSQEGNMIYYTENQNGTGRVDNVSLCNVIVLDEGAWLEEEA